MIGKVTLVLLKNHYVLMNLLHLYSISVLVSSRYNFEVFKNINGKCVQCKASDPGVVFKSFSASQQSMRSI